MEEINFWFSTNERALKDLAEVEEKEIVIINISSSQALDRTLLDKICGTHKRCIFNVLYDDHRYISQIQRSLANSGSFRYSGRDINARMFDKEETKQFVANYDYIRKTYGSEMLINDEFTVEEAVVATNKVNEWAEQINNAMVNGKKLSPYEKFLWAYQIVNSFVYKAPENDDGQMKTSRDLLSVLNSDYIVCAGYASLLSELCGKIGIFCQCRHVGTHMLCTVDLVDPKYDIDGMFVSDPTRTSFIGNPEKVSDIDLSQSLWSYKQANKWNKDTQSLEKDHFYDFTDEYALFGMPFKQYKNQMLEKMLSELKPIFDNPPKSEKSFDADSFNDQLYHIEFLVERFLKTGRDDANTIAYLYNYEGLTWEICKELIEKEFEQIDINNITLFVQQKQMYVQKRKENAKLPTVDGIISAYDTVLTAQGITDKKQRDEEIANALDCSSYNALYGSEFYRDLRTGKSNIERAFDK